MFGLSTLSCLSLENSSKIRVYYHLAGWVESSWLKILKVPQGYDLLTCKATNIFYQCLQGIGQIIKGVNKKIR